MFGYINSIYPVELEIKDTTDADYHASYLDLLLKYDRGPQCDFDCLPMFDWASLTSAFVTPFGCT